MRAASNKQQAASSKQQVGKFASLQVSKLKAKALGFRLPVCLKMRKTAKKPGVNSLQSTPITCNI